MEKISFSNKIAWQVLPNKKFAYACNLKTRQYYQFEDSAMTMWLSIADNDEYSCAAEPPVQCSVSHLSRRSEPQ